MIDAWARGISARALDQVAGPLERRGVRPGTVTALGGVAGAGAAVAAAFALWPLALVLWLLNRALDGLDGAIARLRGATELGGYLDFVVDVAAYGGFVIGVAIALPDARVACAALLGAYYVNATALLAYSAAAERRRLHGRDERTLRLVPGLAEASETTAAYVLICLLPSATEWIAWAFTAVVLATIGQRIHLASRTLRASLPPHRTAAASPPAAASGSRHR